MSWYLATRHAWVWCGWLIHTTERQLLAIVSDHDPLVSNQYF